MISFFIRNTLNSYLVQDNTEVNQMTPIGLDNLSALFILHAVFIGCAVLVQLVQTVLRLTYVNEKFVRPVKKVVRQLKNSTLKTLKLDSSAAKEPQEAKISKQSSTMSMSARIVDMAATPVNSTPISEKSKSDLSISSTATNRALAFRKPSLARAPIVKTRQETTVQRLTRKLGTITAFNSKP